MANLEGWLYRKKITVTGSPDGAQTDYTIPVTVHFGSGTDSGSSVYCSEHCATDFDDIRFTAADGTTLLGQWLDKKTDSDNAVFWVKIPSIGASPATLDVYAYYGNISATAETDIYDAFLTADNFERDFNAGGCLYADSALNIPCYTGSPSNQAIHVSPVDMGVSGFGGYRYWMAFTPYPGGQSAYENPSIVASNDKTTWVVPSGAINPIAPQPSTGFHADTELVYNDTTGEFYIYFKWSYNTLHRIYAIKSSNGITWTDLDGGAITSTNHGTSVLGDLSTQEVCPCVRKNGSAWEMWSGTVPSGTSISAFYYRTSSDGRTWSAPTTCTRTVSQPMWHFSVKYVTSISKYVCLINSDQQGGNVYYMESGNGTAWTVAPVSLLPARSGTWDAWLYRPNFLENGDGTLHVFYSGRSASAVWGTGSVTWELSHIRESLSENSGWTLTGLSFASTWRPVSSPAKRGSRSLQFAREWLPNNVNGKLPISTPHSFVYDIDFYDNGVSSNICQLARVYNATVRVGIGVYTGSSTTNYVYHDTASSYSITSIPRSIGWHKLSFKLLSNSSVVLAIDDAVIATLSGQFNNATHIGIDTVKLANSYVPFWWDDARTRKFTTSEPSITAYATEEYFPDDDTAPVLTAATATATGPTTATASATTDDGNGTLYFLASTNAAESAATVKAALSQSVTADGEQSVSLSALDPETTYYVHFVQINGASLESASVVSTPAFTTQAVPDISIPLAFGDTSPATLLTVQVWSKMPKKADVEGLY